MSQPNSKRSRDTNPVSKRPKLMAVVNEEEMDTPPPPGLQVAANSLIMKKIFEHSFGFNDLKNCRQISRLWYTETLKKWREIAVIRIIPPSQGDSREGWNLSDYLEILQDNDHFYKLDQHPYKKYHAIHFPFYNDDVDQEPQHLSLDHFWIDVGPLMTHLELDRCLFFKQAQQAFENLITEKLPNLQSLVLTGNLVVNGCQMDHDNALAVYQAKPGNWNLRRIKFHGQLPIGLGILLLLTPNIDTLEFALNLDKQNTDLFNLYFIHRMLFNYREIELDWYKDPTHLTLKASWKCTEYPAEKLAIKLSNSSQDKIEDIQNLLIPTVRNFASSLKVLTVFRRPVYKMTYQNAFPQRMGELEELYLHGNIVWDLRFLNMMPYLKTLFIDFKCYEQDKKLENIEDFRHLYRPYKRFEMSTKRVMPDMEHLHLNFRPGSLLNSIKTCMPGLKTLRTVLWQDEFRLVCQELPNLEELVMLYESRIDDDTFTGFTNDSEESHPNNITKLKCLKTLKIQNLCIGWETPGLDARLGDKAVYRGLLELTSLKSVTICASSQMTTQAENALKQHVDSSRIIHNYKNANHTDQDEDCCRVSRFILRSQRLEDFN